MLADGVVGSFRLAAGCASGKAFGEGAECIEHFAIDGFWAAFFGAIIISVVSFFISLIVKPGKVARSVAR